MTELQVGLIGLGVVTVIGVVVYNTWQEYRQRKLAQRVLGGRHADVLLDDTDPVEYDMAPVSIQSSLDADAQIAGAVRVSGEDFQQSGRVEPVLRFESDSNIASGASSSFSGPEEKGKHENNTKADDLLSASIDYIASFEAVEPTPAYQILESQREVLSRLHKPVHWLGHNEISGEWEPIIDDGKSEYRRIRVGLQLVDRHGALADGDLSLFHMAMQDLADEMMAIVELPQRQAALDSAAELDEFCAGVDIQIGLNVISGGVVFPGTKLRALAEAAGMVIDADGRFVRCDDEGNVLYVLLNQEAPGFSVDSMKTLSTHGVTFLLDVPRVHRGERVFNQMVDLARRFADVLRGSLVDDNRQPLSDLALEPIRRQVIQYQSLMAARNLPAGSALTQRLFS